MDDLGIQCYLPARDFLALSKGGPIIDVRSPGEYLQGHIPGTVSVPLFDDAERAEVGTVYAKRGRDAAITLGFQLVAPKLNAYRKAILRHAQGGMVVRMHCWRGGMRSESMGWLMQRVGFRVYLLSGGYKGYRRYVQDYFLTEPFHLQILAGATGSGKTEVLHCLREAGEQVVDLEGLANHRGSAFGAIGLPAQPTTEQFENELFTALRALDPLRTVWLEDESRNIGRVVIPGALFTRMGSAPSTFIHMGIEHRRRRLEREYAILPRGELVQSVMRIERRLGGDRAREIVRMIEAGALGDAIAGVLGYYDRQYLHAFNRRAEAQAVGSGSTPSSGGGQRAIYPAEVFAHSDSAEEIVKEILR